MEQHEAEEQQVENLTEAVAVRSVSATIDTADRAAAYAEKPDAESRKRSIAQQGESAKRERLVETCDDCTQGTVIGPPSPSFITGQPSSSMLDSWLKEELQPGGIVKRIPEGIHVLVPMMVDPDGVLSLCQKVRDTKGAAVVALDTNESHVQAFFEKTAGWNFTVETLQYEPPWYMDASQLEHLTRPVAKYTATSSPLTVYVCDVMDPCFIMHSGILKGSFHRVWDQGQLAHTPPAQRAEWMRKIREYIAAPAQLLIGCSVHEPAEIASSLPGTAYSLRLAEMQALCGSSSSVHRARQVTRSEASLSWLGASAQQACVFWIWLMTDSRAATSQNKLRPPACPCCR